MAFFFNDLLKQAGLDPQTVRLLRHKDNSAEVGKTPYDLWQRDRGAFEVGYQDVQRSSEHAFFGTASHWATFAGLPNGDTLFLGIYAVERVTELLVDRPRPHNNGLDRAGENHIYELSLTALLESYSEKLFIEWGPSKIRWNQYAHNQNKEIIEFRRTHMDEPFPPFIEFSASLSTLNGLPSHWLDALSGSRGVYLLTCPKTKEMYVGSATGTEGFLGRWREYIADGHGGSVELKNREPSDYFVTILQAAGTAETRDEICRSESIWKRKLRPALNRN